MLRIIVGALAAFVGFSFGHSIPEWMDNNGKSASPKQAPSASSASSPSPGSRNSDAQPRRKPALRKKTSFRKLLGSHNSGKNRLFDEGPQHAEIDVSLDHEVFQELDKIHSEFELRDHVSGKLPLQRCAQSAPVKERSEINQWKMALLSLRSKAMASEKVWYEKLDNGGSGGKGPGTAVLKGSARKPTKDRKMENVPQLMSSHRRDRPWSRSSGSRVCPTPSVTRSF